MSCTTIAELREIASGPSALNPANAEFCNLLTRAADELERLRKAIALMGVPICKNLHHEKSDRHDSSPCPVERRIGELISKEET